MGRRKERRRAAVSAAGRRVKLDLSNEPIGELASTSLHADGEGDLDQEKRAEVPTSPSSSGQKQDNPLLLLGQYSDDEVDGDTSKEEKFASEESSSMDTDAKAADSVDHDKVNENTDDTLSSKVKLELYQSDAKSNCDGNDVENNDVVTGVVLGSMTPSTISTCNPVASEMQAVGDSCGRWKLVMHGESNQCYYWNTLTGETSWQVPYSLVRMEGTSGEQITSIVSDLNAGSTTHALDGSVNVGNAGLVSKSIAASDGVESTENIYDAVHSVLNYGASGFYGSASTLLTSSEYFVHRGDEDRANVLTCNFHETTDIHPDELIMQCESLLEKLKAHRSTQTLKYILETEIRLADCKALSSFGSSLLPFWCHTKAELNRLELVLEKEVLNVIKYEDGKKDDGDYCPSSLVGSQLVEHTLTMSEDVHPSDHDFAKESQNEDDHLPGEIVIENENCYPRSACQILEGQPLPAIPEDLETLPSNLISKVDSHDDDVDMDVEMEVDEDDPAASKASRDSLSTECPDPQVKSVQSHTQLVAPIPLEDYTVPPPPVEEWIPPPPPDPESVPALPPEEPPPVPVPPYTEIVHPFPYVEQYNLGYSDPSFQYYTPSVGDSQATGYYAPTDGSHVAEQQTVQYYEPLVSSSYSSVATVVSAEPVVYYDSQSGTVPSFAVVASLDSSGQVASSSYSSVATVVSSEPVVYYDPQSGAMPNFAVSTSLDTSGIYVESESISQSGNSSLVQIGSSGFLCDTGNASLTSQKVVSNSSLLVCDTETTKVKADGLSIACQSSGNVLMNGDLTPAAAVTKNPPKVNRSKKRAVAVAPTFRSNKKVSSLVDKWKAVKELHQNDEEEPENAYEALEKKREREIKEWRARQIASGEAQDNANFLPLGGDWRERVKRRKAESNPESVDTPIEEVAKEKKPDLVELSKGLPSGWQVYWDESSKEVYYGNLNTSETTWKRPSR